MKRREIPSNDGILYVESIVYDVSILDNIIFGLQPELATLFNFGLTFSADKVFIGHHFGPNESFFDI